jgi:hypothetical protein
MKRNWMNNGEKGSALYTNEKMNKNTYAGWLPVVCIGGSGLKNRLRY